jgi:hypothetical protein
LALGWGGVDVKHTIALVLITFLALVCSCKEEPSVPLLITAREGDSPCWKTICAGQGADKTLVVSLLEEIQGVSNIDERVDSSEVGFLWQDPEDNNIQVSGTIYTYQWHLQIIALRPKYKATLGQFIRDFGEPSCVEVVDSTDAKAIDLVYYNLGVRIGLDYIENKGYKYLDKSHELYDIRLFMPINDYTCVDHYPTRAYNWEGFTKRYP